jgi:acetyltransferase-like isoleucine patch superfamily enzyme
MRKLLLRIKRGDGPVTGALRRLAISVRAAYLPLPEFLRPLLRLAYHAHMAVGYVFRWSLTFFYYGPVFRGRCVSSGRRLHVSRMPFVIGHAAITVGNDVNIFGKVDVFTGRMFDAPTLVIGDRVDLGHNVVFVVNKSIEIENDVNVASGVRFMDSDAHPRDTAARIADLAPGEDEIKPVKICRYAWIGQNAFILKGVTVGEGAIVGVNSVVVTDVPPYSVVMGNPARVVVKNLRATAPEGA